MEISLSCSSLFKRDSDDEDNKGSTVVFIGGMIGAFAFMVWLSLVLAVWIGLRRPINYAHFTLMAIGCCFWPCIICLSCLCRKARLPRNFQAHQARPQLLLPPPPPDYAHALTQPEYRPTTPPPAHLGPDNVSIAGPAPAYVAEDGNRDTGAMPDAAAVAVHTRNSSAGITIRSPPAYERLETRPSETVDNPARSEEATREH